MKHATIFHSIRHRLESRNTIMRPVAAIVLLSLAMPAPAQTPAGIAMTNGAKLVIGG